MSKRSAAALCFGGGVLFTARCGAHATPPDEPSVSLASLLPTVADLPEGAESYALEGQEQIVLSIKLDAPSTGLGTELARTFDPPACSEQQLYADAARIGLIEDGAAIATQIDGERSYIVLVSETGLDASRVADAHTGQCSTYTVMSTDNVDAYGRTIRTERLDLPSALASEDAVILSRVSDPDNPEWADDDTLLGYASVDDYNVMVLGYQGKESEAEFGELFANAVDKVRRLS